MASSPFSWSQLAITQLDYDVEVRTPELKTSCEAVRGHPQERKTTDNTTLSVSAAMENPQLEFEQYEKCRQVGFCEALMRFLSMDLCENSPACTEIRTH